MHSFTMVLANERERHSVKVTNVLAVALKLKQWQCNILKLLKFEGHL